jgi:hypothetical protein
MPAHARILPAAAVPLLVMGCQNSRPIGGEALRETTAANPASVIATSQTATLWVEGLACPF